MKKFAKLIGASMLMSVGVIANSAIAQAQDEPVTSVDLGTLDCRGLLKLSGSERQNVVLFLHGYVSGAKKQTVIDLPTLTAATDGVVDECINKPAQNLLMTFLKVRD